MIRVTDKQFFMNPTLVSNLNDLVHNVKKGFQFLIIISGDSRTRVGKTTLAQQIGYYFSYELKREWSNKNIVWGSESLFKKAKEMPKSVFQVDEGREDLNNMRIMSGKVQDMINFINETGKLNNVIIWVLPDFFDLPKAVAIGHSECLINCFLNKKVKTIAGSEVLDYERGYFEYFGWEQKKYLYIKGKKELNYSAVKRSFWGNFPDFWTIDADTYEKEKNDYIHRNRHLSIKRDVVSMRQRAQLIKFCMERGIVQKEIGDYLNITAEAVSHYLHYIDK